jgi:glyoxylase-like metal-dependent hydrolase (beta-lactamase superfamily II)
MSLVYASIEPPAPGAALEIQPGLFWVRMPLPFPPDHINLWLLADGDAGFAIVDTGLHRDDTKALWLAAIGARKISRVICTHFHPDHMGLAGWLCAQYGVELWTTLGEYYTARAVHAQGNAADIAHKVAFYAANGVAADAMGQFASPQNIYRRGVPDLPPFYRRIQGGQALGVGADMWLPMIGRGHCPEHACLSSAARNVLIGGDILLPRITPNIGVWPAEPMADPLREYLGCLDGFAGLPGDVLVLPAHGQPYTGVHARIADIRAHHEERLEKLLEAFAAAPRGLSAVDCFPLLFRREIGPHNVGLAVGEALAHLHLLESRGAARRTRDANGVWRFSAGA